MAEVARVSLPSVSKGQENSLKIALKHAANEFIFSVVGHIGSGTSLIAEQLRDILKNRRLDGKTFDVHIVKARELITAWAKQNGRSVPEEPKDKKPNIKYTSMLQDLGDELRRTTEDNAAVARLAIQRIREI